uniref:Uncharacterized protein n=1 Tax=Alexandrium monilatum TaxID=311494 RepID=A0A7S4SMQ4_9DINO
MPPRRPVQEDELGDPGEGSYVTGYERTIPAVASIPRRAERQPPATAETSGGLATAARRREQIRKERAARAATTYHGRAAPMEEEDLLRLSVEELRARVAAAGATIPRAVVDKAELVTLLQIFSKSAARPAGQRLQASESEAWAEPPAAELREPAAAYGDSAVRPSDQRSTTSTAQPQVSQADEADKAEDLSLLPLKEMKRRLRELDVAIPASVCEKSEIVELLHQAMHRPALRAAAAPRFSVLQAPAAAAEEEAPKPASEARPRGMQAWLDRKADRARREEEESGGKMDFTSSGLTPEEPAMPRRTELTREERLEEARRKALEERRINDRKREESLRRREREMEERAQREAAEAPPPVPEGKIPSRSTLAALSLKEIKTRLQEAGTSIPPSAIEKSDLVDLLKWTLERQAAAEVTKMQNAQHKKKPAEPMPCMNRCGFARTWHPTHCCHNCPNHGPKCDRKVMTKGWQPSDDETPGHRARGAGGTTQLPCTVGDPDSLEHLKHLSVKELKKMCGSAGVTVRRSDEREEIIRMLQDAQRRRRCLRRPGEAEAEAAGEGKEEDFSKLGVKELRMHLQTIGAKIPPSVMEKSELVNLLKQARKRLPGSCNPKEKFMGANGSYDRRRTDDAAPWMLGNARERTRSGEQVPPPFPNEDDGNMLWQTFGYIAGLEEGSPYARFDIREATCMRFGGFKHGTVIRERSTQELSIVVGVKRCSGRPLLFIHPKNLNRPGCHCFAKMSSAKLRNMFVEEGEDELDEVNPADMDVVEDSDEELHKTCSRCGLPCGDLAYVNSEEVGGKERVQHADCISRGMIESTLEQDKQRLDGDWDRTWANRKKFDVGWVPDRMIPVNEKIARRLSAGPVPGGPMISLLMSESNPPTISLTQSIEPTTSVNLSYLITALKVRLHEGREPVFSLDPCPPFDDLRNGFQKKRFDPEWMRGSPAGEVLFQADYHLKELSMGEYTQPVVGMKSCFDFHVEDGHEVEWNAREWFVVRKAEVHLTEENALIGHVDMGVEAREQIAGEKGLEDALLTSPEHPLVRYAEAFEHNFDLIAERKSVVYHLRELSKASVLAKFLVDNEVLMEDSWFDFEVEADEKCLLEIPQLWNERFHSQIAVRDGKILDADQGITATKHGLYGGVQMGLERAQVPGVAVRARGPPLVMAKGQLSRATAASTLLASGQEGFAYTPMPGVGAPRGVAPRGVDLNLDGFNLSEAKRAEQGMPAFATGSAFFRSLDGSGKGFSEEDASLFKSLFNPVLSDRRMEGDLFVPPDASPEYLERLRALLKEEQLAFEQRKEHFLSPGFVRDAPGPLFPSDWVPAHGITHGQAQGTRKLHVRSDYGTRMERMLRTATPVFDKAAEDGTKFRIYEVGSLEVRTLQEHDGQERIGVVFSTRAPRSERSAVGDIESKHDGTVVRATMFVETTAQTKDSKRPPADIRFYVVFETLGGDLVMTERIGDRTLWVQNPDELEARNSYAKVTRSVDCSSMGITILDVKEHQERELASIGRTEAECASYADGVYRVVLPAWQRSWSMLAERERLAAEELGLQALWAQEGRSKEASDLSWCDLDEAQRELARSLGLDEAAWGRNICWARAEQRRA